MLLRETRKRSTFRRFIVLGQKSVPILSTLVGQQSHFKCFNVLSLQLAAANCLRSSQSHINVGDGILNLSFDAIFLCLDTRQKLYLLVYFIEFELLFELYCSHLYSDTIVRVRTMIEPWGLTYAFIWSFYRPYHWLSSNRDIPNRIPKTMVMSFWA